MADLHKAARDKAVERLEVGGEARSMSQPEWLASQYTPDTTAVQHGVRQGVANAMALPQFVMDLADAPNTFISNVLMGKPRQDYLRRFDAASRAYGRDITGATEYEDFARTPGNIAGDLSLQIGTEVMMPLGGGYTALRSPKKARDLGNGVVDYLDPGFDESRRRFGKNVAVGTAAMALGIPAAKKAASSVKKAASSVKATAKPPAGKWDKIIDEIYDAKDPLSRPERSSFLRGDADEIARLHRKQRAKTYEESQWDEYVWDNILPSRDKGLGRKDTTMGRWDHEYDVRQAMGPENYDRLKELSYMPDSGLPRNMKDFDEASRLGRLKGKAIIKADQRQADLLTPENREIYRKMNEEASDLLVRKMMGRSDVYNSHAGLDGIDLFESFPRDIDKRLRYLDDEITRLLRTDPNVSAYRRQRAKARAADIGDELYEKERLRLLRRETDAEYMYNTDTVYDDFYDVDFSRANLDRAKAALERHLEIGKQVGLD